MRHDLGNGNWSALLRLRGPFTVVGASTRLDAVFLARDPLGQRPLYYATLPGAVIASSSLAAVLEHPDVADTLDEEALALYLARCFHALSERTIHRHVRQVPPGTVVTVGAGGTGTHRYWDPGQIGPPSTEPLPQRVRGLRDLLTTVVAEYTRCRGGAVAAHVSGGLDSTAVAAFADRALRERGDRLQAAYSWGPSPTQVPLHRDYDERRFLLAAAAGPGWDVRYAPALPECDRSDEDPLRGPMLSWGFEARVAADAQQRGVQVMLTGWGGDELISGHGKLRVPELLHRGHWATALREARSWSRDRRSQLRILDNAVRQVASHRGWLPAHAVRDHTRGLNEQLFELWHEQWPTVADQLRVKWAALRNARTVREGQLAQLANGHLPARNASWYLGGLRFGIDYRSPLQDRRIVEFALRSDSGCFQHHGWRRVMFRLAVAPYVPTSVAWRLGKDDRVHRADLIANPPPPLNPRQPQARPLAELARRHHEIVRSAVRDRQDADGIIAPRVRRSGASRTP